MEPALLLHMGLMVILLGVTAGNHLFLSRCHYECSDNLVILSST